jgi:hypothetical protein
MLLLFLLLLLFFFDFLISSLIFDTYVPGKECCISAHELEGRAIDDMYDLFFLGFFLIKEGIFEFLYRQDVHAALFYLPIDIPELIILVLGG